MDFLGGAEGGCIRLLILFGGEGLGDPRKFPLSDTPLTPGRTGLGLRTMPASCLVSVRRGEALLAFTVFVKGETFFEGGGGRGMLGGGGIMRLVGLLTFFILALALGGGTGVPTGVTVWTPLEGSLDLGFSAVFGAALLAVGVVGRACGAGGGGRIRGLVLLSIPVVRLFILVCCCCGGGWVGLGDGVRWSAPSLVA